MIIPGLGSSGTRTFRTFLHRPYTGRYTRFIPVHLGAAIRDRFDELASRAYTEKQNRIKIRSVVISMKTYNFKVVLEPDEDADGNPAWHAYCPALESVGGATSGRTREEALNNINEVVHMIVQEFVEEGKALPEGPGDSVEVEEVSQEEPRIAVTV